MASDFHRRIALLGATGSIGTSALAVVREHPAHFSVASLAAGGRVAPFVALAVEFPQARLCLFDAEAAREAQRRLGRPVLSGMTGLCELATDPDSDTLINGLVGSIGCLPTMEAIRAGKRICLANKETLVMAGCLIEELLARNPQATLVPVDSEHSAIHQCLAGRPTHEVEAVVLTASGGPFRQLPAEDFDSITVETALCHPTWSMGPKITVDSATLFNKGLEVIEAHHLFGIDYERIEVLVHPGSHVHSLVRFVDGSFVAQLGTPDMRLPILYALCAPLRLPLRGERLNLARIGILRFEHPDHSRFPAFGLALRAGRAGGTAPAVANAANEQAVALFLERRIGFRQIPELVAACLDRAAQVAHPTLEEVLEADAWARRHVADAARSPVLTGTHA